MYKLCSRSSVRRHDHATTSNALRYIRTHYHILVPVTSTEVDWLAGTHVLHDLLNVPWLVLVAWWVVWRELVLVLHLDALLLRLNGEVVVLVDILLWVVAPDPLWQTWGGTARVELYFLPVGVLEELGVGETKLLSACVTDEPGMILVFDVQICLRWVDEPEADVSAGGLGNVVLAADLKAGSERDGVLDSLSCTVTRGWQERVGGVTDLDDTSTW